MRCEGCAPARQNTADNPTRDVRVRDPAPLCLQAADAPLRFRRGSQFWWCSAVRLPRRECLPVASERRHFVVTVFILHAFGLPSARRVPLDFLGLWISPSLLHRLQLLPPFWTLDLECLPACCPCLRRPSSASLAEQAPASVCPCLCLPAYPEPVLKPTGFASC